MPTLLVLPAINDTRELGAMPKRSMSMLMLRVSMAPVNIRILPDIIGGRTATSFAHPT